MDDQVHPTVARLLAAAKKATAEDDLPVIDYATLATRLRVSAAVITNWKSRGVSMRGALNAESSLGVSAAFVMGDHDEPGYSALGHAVRERDHDGYSMSIADSVSLTGNDAYPAIKRVKFKLAAGASGFEVDYLSNDGGAPIVFRKDWYDSRGFRPANLYAIRVSGASMEPGLWDGDTVVVNTADNTPRDGEVFAVNYEGEAVVKRLVRDSGQWWLSSDNPDQRRFPRKLCDEACTVLGRIVHKQSEHI